jgi:hypothetical protein
MHALQFQVDANRSSAAYDPSHEHRARRSLKNVALGRDAHLNLSVITTLLSG